MRCQKSKAQIQMRVVTCTPSQKHTINEWWAQEMTRAENCIRDDGFESPRKSRSFKSFHRWDTVEPTPDVGKMICIETSAASTEDVVPTCFEWGQQICEVPMLLLVLVGLWCVALRRSTLKEEELKVPQHEALAFILPSVRSAAPPTLAWMLLEQESRWSEEEPFQEEDQPTYSVDYTIVHIKWHDKAFRIKSWSCLEIS